MIATRRDVANPRFGRVACVAPWGYQKAMELALYQPEIAGNVGAVLRTAACLGVPVHIIEPCGFPLSSAALKRAAMDYGQAAEVTRHADWDAFTAAIEGRRPVLFSTHAAEPIDRFEFTTSDVLMFGSESAGVPDHVRDAIPARVRIPIASGMRSLNLSVAAGIALFEALRQTGGLSD